MQRYPGLALTSSALRNGDRYTYSTPVVRVGRYMSLPLLPDRGLQPNFAVALHRLAINVSAAYDHPEIQRMLESTRHEGLVALVASYEAWMNADPEVCEAAKKKGVRFADIPSSKEIRHVYAIDVALQTWTVHRIRGEAPEVRREGGGGPDDKDAFTFRGSVPQDMHAFLMAILGEPVAELPNTPSLWDPAAERARGWKPQ